MISLFVCLFFKKGTNKYVLMTIIISHKTKDSKIHADESYIISGL